jgi:hypothetical protein
MFPLSDLGELPELSMEMATAGANAASHNVAHARGVHDVYGNVDRYQ